MGTCDCGFSALRKSWDICSCRNDLTDGGSFLMRKAQLSKKTSSAVFGDIPASAYPVPLWPVWSA